MFQFTGLEKSYSVNPLNLQELNAQLFILKHILYQCLKLVPISFHQEVITVTNFFQAAIFFLASLCKQLSIASSQNLFCISSWFLLIFPDFVSLKISTKIWLSLHEQFLAHLMPARGLAYRAPHLAWHIRVLVTLLFCTVFLVLTDTNVNCHLIFFFTCRHWSQQRVWWEFCSRVHC